MSIYLFGDSVFDNAAYVQTPEQSVPALLARKVSEQVILRAVDGAVTDQVPLQIQGSRNEVRRQDWVFLSSGGNDALKMIEGLKLDLPQPPLDLIRNLDGPIERFSRNYQELVEALVDLSASVVLLTIYRSNLPRQIAGDPKFGSSLICLYNGVIWEQASRFGLKVLDTYSLLTEEEDYNNVIEPSEQGGEKIAMELARKILGDGSAKTGTSSC